MATMSKYQNLSVAELEAMDTLAVGQADDLKIDDGEGTRVWLSRMTVEDGQPYNNQVTIERLIDGRWETVEEYEAK
jgi:hypothetical protein